MDLLRSNLHPRKTQFSRVIHILRIPNKQMHPRCFGRSKKRIIEGHSTTRVDFNIKITHLFARFRLKRRCHRRKRYEEEVRKFPSRTAPLLGSHMRKLTSMKRDDDSREQVKILWRSSWFSLIIACASSLRVLFIGWMELPAVFRDEIREGIPSGGVHLRKSPSREGPPKFDIFPSGTKDGMMGRRVGCGLLQGYATTRTGNPRILR